jgi:hypothetical protein
MSLSTLGTIAAQRDKGRPRRAKRKPRTREDAEATEESGYLNLLVAAIPTEPLALYTALVGGIVATIETGDDELLFLRWLIYAGGIVYIAAWLGTSYFRRPKADKKRKFPWAETAAAVVAFAAWGLVMPESPLYAELEGDQRVVWTLVITAAGAAILGLITGSLKQPAGT